jgi:hypothetical protein
MGAHDKSPLAPERFPDLPVVAGVSAAIGRLGLYKHPRDDLMFVTFPGYWAQTASVATSVRAPDKSCSEHRLRAREAASSSQGSSCCRALSARVLVKVRVVVVDMMDGWMDGWVGDLIATVDTSSRVS